MSDETAIELIDMMRGVVRRGTGTEVRNRFNIVADIAGKTGTTQNNTDGWFILMHPNLVAGAWVGFNDTRVTMRSSYWGQGGHNAILLVVPDNHQSVNWVFTETRNDGTIYARCPIALGRDDAQRLLGPGRAQRHPSGW